MRPPGPVSAAKRVEQSIGRIDDGKRREFAFAANPSIIMRAREFIERKNRRVSTRGVTDLDLRGQTFHSANRIVQRIARVSFFSLSLFLFLPSQIASCQFFREATLTFNVERFAHSFIHVRTGCRFNIQLGTTGCLPVSHAGARVRNVNAFSHRRSVLVACNVLVNGGEFLRAGYKKQRGILLIRWFLPWESVYFSWRRTQRGRIRE